MTIVCLTIWQPYASAIMASVKRSEQRNWRILPGRIYVHAGKTVDAWAPEDWLEQFSEPLGVILGSVQITECTWNSQTREYDWMLDDVRPLPWPVPARGLPRLWCPEPDVQEEVLAQL